jgi:hypothetical protein
MKKNNSGDGAIQTRDLDWTRKMSYHCTGTSFALFVAIYIVNKIQAMSELKREKNKKMFPTKN